MGKSGDHRIIDQLVGAHYESLYRYAYRLSGTAADAEDLTQETYCVAQRKLSQLRQESSAKPWLFRILRNIFLQRQRNHGQVRVLPLSAADDVPSEQESVPEIDPQQLQKVLDEMPEEFRTAVILFHFEEFSYREIAEQMELPIGTVMSRLSRGREFLRSRLQQREVTPSGRTRRERSGADAM